MCPEMRSGIRCTNYSVVLQLLHSLGCNPRTHTHSHTHNQVLLLFAVHDGNFGEAQSGSEIKLKSVHWPGIEIRSLRPNSDDDCLYIQLYTANDDDDDDEYEEAQE